VKLFTSRPEPAPEPAVNVQTRPARFAAGDIGAIGQVKVDLAYSVGNTLVVAGWRSVPVDLALFSHGTRLKTRTVTVARADVAAHLNLGDTSDLGFVLIAEQLDTLTDLSFGWRGTGQAFQQSALLATEAPDSFSAADHGALGSAIALFSTHCARYSAE